MAKRKTESEAVESIDVAVADYPEVHVPDPVAPPMHDPAWQDYCMGLFVDGEVNEKGLPYLKGLRRVAELAIGPIVSMDTHVVHGPCPETDFTAAATCRVGFASTTLGRDVFFSGAGDVIPGENLEPAFARFPTAMAETRARVRALRNALRLDKVAAEECTDLPVVEREVVRKDAAQGYQIGGIKKLCRDYGIDPIMLVNQFGSNYGKLEEMTKDGAAKALKLLGEYGRDLDLIPDSIKVATA